MQPVAAEVSAANQRKLRDAIVTIPDLDFEFSIIELSELLEHGCILNAMGEGKFVQSEYEAQLSGVVSALQFRGAAVMSSMAAYLNKDETSGIDTARELVALCQGSGVTK